MHQTQSLVYGNKLPHSNKLIHFWHVALPRLTGLSDESNWPMWRVSQSHSFNVYHDNKRGSSSSMTSEGHAEQTEQTVGRRLIQFKLQRRISLHRHWQSIKYWWVLCDFMYLTRIMKHNATDTKSNFYFLVLLFRFYLKKKQQRQSKC